MAPEKKLLSISVLVSNRPGTVGKCLKSLDSLRGKVPSELILVDTGCGEEVRKIIEPYADKIVDFEWCDDFSKARNAGLKQAKGEWFLYLDDDEWFEDTQEIENFFLSDKHLHYNCGSYLVRNYFDLDGKRYKDEYVGRLIRLEPDMEFKYSIHEVFSKARMPRIRLHSYVHHYGYAFKTEEDMRRHSQRNIRLLLEEHAKEPAELRHNAQLAQEYNALKEWEKSVEISMEGIHNARPGISAEQFLGGLYVNAVRNHMTLEQYYDAISVGKKYLSADCSNELARAAVHYNLCISYLEIKEFALSMEAVEGYLEFYEKWEKDRDATAFYECLTIPFLSEGCRQAALCIGVQAACRLGNSSLAKRYFARLDWVAIQTILTTQSVQGMIQVLVSTWICTDADASQDYTDMMRTLLKDRVMAGLVMTEMDLLYRNTPELLQTKKADWAALADENWFFLYLKLKNRIKTDRNIIAIEYGKLWKEPMNSLMRAKELDLWEMARQDNVDMGQVISAIPLYRWEKAVGIAVEEMDWQDAQEIQMHLTGALDADSLYMFCWSIPYRMRKIRMMMEEGGEEKGAGGSLEGIVRELLAYAAENESLYRRLYREELFRETPDLLPQGCRVSLMLLDMEDAVGGGDFQRALSDLREALDVMPELSDALKCCTRWISEISVNRDKERDAARDEMGKLAEAVKLQVRNMAAQGMLTEAIETLHRLMELVPEDEEAKQLEKEFLQK